jgi:hypothetical protein
MPILRRVLDMIVCICKLVGDGRYLPQLQHSVAARMSDSMGEYVDKSSVAATVGVAPEDTLELPGGGRGSVGGGGTAASSSPAAASNPHLDGPGRRSSGALRVAVFTGGSAGPDSAQPESDDEDEAGAYNGSSKAELPVESGDWDDWDDWDEEEEGTLENCFAHSVSRQSTCAATGRAEHCTYVAIVVDIDDVIVEFGKCIKVVTRLAQAPSDPAAARVRQRMGIRPDGASEPSARGAGPGAPPSDADACSPPSDLLIIRWLLEKHDQICNNQAT